ncbi:MAG: flagellar assembly protein FliH [Spirochaetaceae bacterium]|jgi:flagellar assembly protein FliH|nr:flagellar assembly protein FliH [Spirochaetaceae bacterium]
MAKVVLRANEFVPVQSAITLQVSNFENVAPVKADTEEVQVYDGPTVEDLRREAEAWMADWENRKAEMMRQAEEEAQQIIADAHEQVEAEISEMKMESSSLRARADEDVEKIMEEAKVRAQEIIDEAMAQKEAVFNEAKFEAAEAGRTEGYDAGFTEAKRLVERVHTIIERIADSREQVLEDAEAQVIDLVLLIARKVVKTISENQRDVVVENICEALKKVKRKGDVIIHVNLADLELTTKQKSTFIDMLEKNQNVTIIEDTSVDVGGCVVETDFGSIDARISSQLSVLEQRISELSPVRKTRKSANISSPPTNTKERAEDAFDAATGAAK